MTIGIPAGLLYHYYGSAWRTFLEALGQRVVVSGMTTKTHMDLGVLNSPPEACIPLKVFMGHLAELAARPDVDAVFVPRHCSLEPGYHFCPKLMGLPDVVGYAVPELKGKLVIAPWISMSRGVADLRKPAIDTAAKLGVGRSRALAALDKALADYRGMVAGGAEPRRIRRSIRIAVLGYPYNVHDGFLSMDAGKKLESLGIEPVFLEDTDYRTLRQRGTEGGRNLFWTFGDWVYRAGRNLMETGAVQGLLHITSFGCGPDAIVGKMLDLDSKALGVPFMTIRIDEHTGESHLLTRLEAFADVVLARGVGA